MATSSGRFLATIYNQSQLAERKHVARYWLINTVATAVPLSEHPCPLVITTKLATAILGVLLFGGGVLLAQYYPCESYILKIIYAALWSCLCCCTDPEGVTVWHCCRLVGTWRSHLRDVGRTAAIRSWQWGWVIRGNPTRWCSLPRLAE